MNKITCVIVDDERNARETFQEICTRYLKDKLEVKGLAGSVKEAVELIKKHQPEIVFLDIEMPDESGFKLFDHFSQYTFEVIFTTAFDQYAIKAFQVNSISYLLKPIRKADLADSLKKYQTLKSAFSIDFDMLLANIQGRDPDYKKRFLIQIGEKIKKIEASEIAYFYVLDKGVYLRTFQGNSYAVEYTLDKLETILNPSSFFRINRKYLVNMDSIANMVAYSRGRVKLELKPNADDELDTVVSIDRSADFKKWLNS